MHSTRGHFLNHKVYTLRIHVYAMCKLAHLRKNIIYFSNMLSKIDLQDSTCYKLILVVINNLNIIFGLNFFTLTKIR
jgi:hypothetical protein